MHTSRTDSIELPTPFFVVGYPRSGTTLLASILNRHSMVCVPPETHFFPKSQESRFRVASSKRVSRRAGVRSITDNIRMQDLDLDLSSLEMEIPDPVAWDELLELILHAYASKAGKPIVGEKTPQHLFYVDRILAWFPAAKIICMVRDPRDCVDSMMRVPWTHKNPGRHAAHWQFASDESTRLGKRYPNNFFVVRIEDLLEDPVTVTDGICRTVGVDYEQAMLEPGGENAVPAWEREWKSRSSKSLDASNVYRWTRAVDNGYYKLVSVICARGIHRFGYEPGVEDTDRVGNVRLRTMSMFYSPPFYRTLYVLLELRRRLLLRNRSFRHKLKDD